jgi:hypothetical protein
VTPTTWIWVVLVVVWGLFFSWYTSFGGPLTNKEIELYMDRMANSEPTPGPDQLEQMRQFMEEDTGDDFVMINIGDLYATPLLIEGVEPGQSTEEVMTKYLAYVFPALLPRASHPVLVGMASSRAFELINAEGLEKWGNGLAMRYRSRRDFMEFLTDPRMAPAHKFKVAASRSAIAFPADPWYQLTDPRLLLGLFLGLIGCALSWRLASRRAMLELRRRPV